MPAFLLRLIPLRDWLYAALAVAAIVFWFHHDHVEQAAGAARVTAAVNAASAKAGIAAQAEISRITSAHSADVAKIEDNYEKIIQANDASHATDLQRLRDSAARNSRPNSTLGSSASGTTPADPGTSGASGLGDVPAKLGLELADALRADDAALLKCYADRDSLTGK